VNKNSNTIPEDFVPNFNSIGSLYSEAIKELTTPPEAVRLPRSPLLDDMLGGLRPHEFSILCGSTGAGKTTLLANLAVEFMMQGTEQYIASVETGHVDFIKRMISAHAQKDWNTGDPIPEKIISNYSEQFMKLFMNQKSILALYDNRIGVEILMKEIEYAYENFGTKVCMLDNLNFFLDVKSSKDQIVEMDRVTHEFIMFCKRMPIHMIMVMHPKKTESGRVLNEFDIKGSSTAVQEAHNVLLFNRPDPKRDGVEKTQKGFTAC